jgi:hypothetical protein
LDHTLIHTLPDVVMTYPGLADLRFRLGGPAPVQVQFVHEPGTPDLPTLRNGDPGEPGVPEYFDFKHIITQRALVLTTPDGELRTLIPRGYDLCKVLDQRQLDALEWALLARRRAADDDARLDTMGRAMASLVVGYP